MIIFNNGRSEGDGGLRAQTLEQIKDEAKHSLRASMSHSLPAASPVKWDGGGLFLTGLF